MVHDCIDHGQKGSVDGYGHSGPEKLHRKLFIKHHGFAPEVVMHTCDNPRCINLDHLKAGTWDENNKDRARKGRSAKRVDSRRKITQEQAEEIKIRWSQRNPKRDKVNGVLALAREFGVDTGVIYNITKGKSHFYE